MVYATHSRLLGCLVVSVRKNSIVRGEFSGVKGRAFESCPFIQSRLVWTKARLVNRGGQSKKWFHDSDEEPGRKPFTRSNCAIGEQRPLGETCTVPISDQQGRIAHALDFQLIHLPWHVTPLASYVRRLVGISLIY